MFKSSGFIIAVVRMIIEWVDICKTKQNMIEVAVVFETIFKIFQVFFWNQACSKTPRLFKRNYMKFLMLREKVLIRVRVPNFEFG